MTLKEKLKSEIIAAPVMDEVIEYWTSELEQIADEFAIGFAEWTWNKELITVNDCDYFEYKFNLYTRKEALEIYKKEKGL